MKTKRVRLKQGRKTKSFVLTGGPVPKKGDVCTIDGQDWTVITIEDTSIIAEFSTEGGKLKQVFP